MRFSANGPAIPSHLLEQQQLGNVIFFCGAGLSIPAGLPSFAGLTDALINLLGATKARQALRDGASSDRVFSLLLREFGRQEIDSQLDKVLRTTCSVPLDNHRSVLRLSRGPDGNTQIVTTNFDLLFYQADTTIRSIVAPHLPDLELQPRFDGVVYLHGQLAEVGPGISSGYIIGASDFGRAYLADAWATRFVKALRERYTVVLLGYRAEDPPMRYLLEGLNTRGSDAYDTPIYAFVAGDQGDAEEEWFDRGVTPICYDPANDHAALWDTLSSWSQSVNDPIAWTHQVTSLAERRPSELMPYERGQVAQLVSTKRGANIFAEITPHPPAEWLCVFDNYVRYSKPRSKDWRDRREIDPLDQFGLDDDPARPLPKGNGTSETVGINLLSAQPADVGHADRSGLFNSSSAWQGSLPERLFHLTRWFVAVMDQPAAIWWAAGYRQLNPGLSWHIRRRLRDRSEKLPEPASLLWRLYSEFNPPPEEFRWYDFKEQIAAEGWNNATLRSFEAIVQPQVEFSRHLLAGPCPPEANWGEIHFRQVVEPMVRVLDRHGDNIEIPDGHLAEVVGILRRSLIRCGHLLDETEVPHWSAPTLHPTDEPGETIYGRKAHYLLWFKQLFLRLVELDPEAGSAEVRCWPLDDRYFFGRLNIFVAMLSNAIPHNAAFGIVMGVSDVVFWDSGVQREMLFTLRVRWSDFSEVQRRKIERRILQGPSQWEEEKPVQYRKRRAVHASSRLRWLELNGCQLTDATVKNLKKIIKIDPRWNDDWAKTAGDSLGGRSGWVETVKEVRGLDQLAPSEIVDAAIRLTEDRHGEFRHYRPFDGLVEARPFLALSALRISLRSRERHLSLWMSLLNDWPADVSMRLLWLMAETLSRLSHDLALELRYCLPRWLQKHILKLYAYDKKRALVVFDGIAAPYLSASSEMTDSGMGNLTIGGVEQAQSQVSIGKAINSPVGILAESLWSLLPEKTSKKRKMPPIVGGRLQRIFKVPGDGAGHAVCVVAQHMGWLDYWYADWVSQVMLPMFDLDKPLSEAAWHGLARDHNGLRPETLPCSNPPIWACSTGARPGASINPNIGFKSKGLFI